MLGTLRVCSSYGSGNLRGFGRGTPPSLLNLNVEIERGSKRRGASLPYRYGGLRSVVPLGKCTGDH